MFPRTANPWTEQQLKGASEVERDATEILTGQASSKKIVEFKKKGDKQPVRHQPVMDTVDSNKEQRNLEDDLRPHLKDSQEDAI